MPQLIPFKHGRKLVWSEEENEELITMRNAGMKHQEIAEALNVTFRVVAKQLDKLGHSRKNGATITRIFREEFHLLEEIAESGLASRKRIQDKFGITCHKADILRDVVLAIQGRNALRNAGITNVKVTERGRIVITD